MSEPLDERWDRLSRLVERSGSQDLAQAVLMLRNGQPEQARKLLQGRVLAGNPNHGTAHAVLGFALRQAGLPGSVDCFSRVLAVSLDPGERALALHGMAQA